MKKHKVVIAGGSGMIGSRLTKILLEEGYEVWWLSRSGSSQPGVQTAKWDPRKGSIEAGALEGALAVLNLAGEGIADGRWTKDRKRRIIQSRTESTRLLAQTMLALPSAPAAFIGASASGYYGDRGDEVLTENSPPGGKGFHSNSVMQIEAAITEHVPHTIRTVIPRFGVVLSNQGGALPKFTRPLKFGIASYMGRGRQHMPWIHIDDLCRFLLSAIRDESIQGVYNLSAPNPITSRAFATALRKTYNPVSLVFPVPAFALRLVFGEMADTILDSANVVPERLNQSDFEFRYPDIHSSLSHLKRTGH